MPEVHAIVWLDHREARIASFSLGSSQVIEVLPALATLRLRSRHTSNFATLNSPRE